MNRKQVFVVAFVALAIGASVVVPPWKTIVSSVVTQHGSVLHELPDKVKIKYKWIWDPPTSMTINVPATGDPTTIAHLQYKSGGVHWGRVSVQVIPCLALCAVFCFLLRSRSIMPVTKDTLI
jgi:hypothetical protein